MPVNTTERGAGADPTSSSRSTCSSSERAARRMAWGWAAISSRNRSGNFPNDFTPRELYPRMLFGGSGGSRVGLKVAVVGAGSTYTPELVEGFVSHRDRLPVDELAMLDVDPERLDIVGEFSRRILSRQGWDGDLVLTADRDRALEGASFVVV